MVPEQSTRSSPPCHNPTSYVDGTALTLGKAVSPVNRTLKKYRARREGCHNVVDVARIEDAGNNNVAWDIREGVIEQRKVAGQPAADGNRLDGSWSWAGAWPPSPLPTLAGLCVAPHFLRGRSEH